MRSLQSALFFFTFETELLVFAWIYYSESFTYLSGRFFQESHCVGEPSLQNHSSGFIQSE